MEIYRHRSYGAYECHGCRLIRFVYGHDTTKKYFCPDCVSKTLLEPTYSMEEQDE